MKNSSDSKRITRFLQRNGVYIALTISIVAVGGVLFAGLTRQISKPNNNDSLNAQQQVEQKVTGQRDTRTGSTTVTTSSTVKDATATNSFEAPHLYLLPLTNTVQKEFSTEGPLYCETMQDWRLHLGADFAGSEGQDVKAVTRGTVITVQSDPMWGGVVEIDHGVGVITRYCGVKSIVRVGDKVEMGQVIGNLQIVPCECAQSAHLHLEMKVDDTPIDPVAAIGLDVRYAETTD